MRVEILPSEGCPVTLCSLMVSPPKIFKLPGKNFLIACLAAFVVMGCAGMSSHQTAWYDWDESWSRSDLAHASMMRPLSARKIRQAVNQRVPQDDAKPRLRATSRRATVSVSQRTRNRVSKTGTRASAKGSVRYKEIRSSKSPRKRKTVRTSKRNRSVSKVNSAPIASSTAPTVTKAARDLGLGNGSPSSEFLSAATRLLGIKDGFLHKSFLRHLLSVSAIDLSIKAPHNVYAGLVFEHFRAKGYEVKSPKPGDLVFFSTPFGDGQASEDRFTAAAGLEAIEPGGVYRCIGWVLGEVQRFKMDPRRPTLRRDERSGERINDVIRERSMGEGTRQPALAGQLLSGFLRL